MALDSSVITDVIAQLQATTLKLVETAAQVDAVAESLADHNADSTAHPYIRNLIASLSAVSTSDITAAVTAHDNSSTAHSDMRSQIASLTTSVANITALVGSGIASHNDDQEAHPYLLGIVTELDKDMQVVRDNEDLIDRLPELFENSGTDSNTLTKVADLAYTDMTLSDRMDDLANVQDKTLITAVKTSDSLSDVLLDIVSSQVAIKGITLNSGFANQQVDLMGFTHTFPTLVAQSTTVPVSFTGITVPEGDTVEYSIDAASSGFTFSKTTGIADDELVNVTIPAEAVSGTIKYFIVTVKLVTANTTSRVAVATKINTAPMLDNLMSDVPEKGEPGMSYAIKFWGFIDLDGQSLTCNLVPLTGDLVFSKTTGITANEVIQMDIPGTLARNDSATFKLQVVDPLGAMAERTYSLLATSLPDATGLVNTLPSRVVPGKSYPFTLYGATSTDGSSLFYAIAEQTTSVFTFSKTTNIVDNASLTLTVDAAAPRGVEHTVRISIITALGSTTTVDVPITINDLPVVTGVATNLPEEVRSQSTTTFAIAGATDPNSDTMTYNILNPSLGLVFSKTSAIVPGANLTVTVPKTVTATTYTFDVQAVDALNEASATNKTISLDVIPNIVTPTITNPTDGATMSSDVFTFTFSSLTLS